MSCPDSWDAEAARFDQEPDHGLGDPETREAWRTLLREHLPQAPCDVVDLGCGTGTLSVLLAQDGHRVRGLDFSPVMVAAARTKHAEAGLDVGAHRDNVEVRLLPEDVYWGGPITDERYLLVSR